MFRILSRIFAKDCQKIQTFSYFIPSPPKRDTGYREKQFDKEFYKFINRGYKILSINTQSCSDPSRPGMWFICTAQAKNPEAAKLDLTDEITQDSIDQEFQSKLIYDHDLLNKEGRDEKLE